MSGVSVLRALAGLRHAGDAWAGALLWVGLVVVALAHLVGWWRDRAFARRVRAAYATPAPRLASTPPVSILVAAWNEAALIERHIQSVLALRYPNREYLLCAGGEDGTLALARRHAGPRVRVLEQRRGEGKAVALGRCLAQASGEIAYLTDADCLVHDDAFERALAPLINDGAVAATGTVVPVPEQRARDFVRLQWATAAHAGRRRGDRALWLSGQNAAVRMDALRRSGVFGDGHLLAEDYVLALRLRAAGHEIHFVRPSRVHTWLETSPSGYLRQQSRWMKGRIVHGAQYRAWSHVATTIWASGSALAFAALLGLWPLIGRAAPALWLVGLAHVLARCLRHLAYAAVALDLAVRPSTVLSIAWYGPLALARFAYGAIDLCVPGATRRW
jgi:cellulose synthase/poly-beta-1,6-N-acetylglucosamine synthase-like glycosyltransferase